MAIALHRRLLYLCSLSYALDPGNTLTPHQARSLGLAARDAAIGASAPHTVIGGLTDPQSGLPRDVALVTGYPEGVVIAFRGTQPPTLASAALAKASLKDWLNNAAVKQVPFIGVSGLVHNGFAEALDSVWLALITAINARLAVGDVPRKLILTGHSKGGALANLAAMRLKAEPAFQNVPVEVATFAAARVGDKDFAAAYNLSGVKCTRYEVWLDVVPDLPPGTGSNGLGQLLLAKIGFDANVKFPDYRSVGQLVTDRTGLAALREALPDLKHGGKAMNASSISGLFDWTTKFTWQPALVKAHDIGPGSAYDGIVPH
jgi:hypothetical protein